MLRDRSYVGRRMPRPGDVLAAEKYFGAEGSASLGALGGAA